MIDDTTVLDRDVEENSSQTTEDEASEQTQEQTSEQTTEQTTEPVWRDQIQDDQLRQHAEQYSTIEDLAKHDLQMRQKLSKAIVPPGKDATDKEIADYKKRLGVPENSEAYDLRIPDEHKDKVDFINLERVDAFKPVFAEYNIPQEAASALFNKVIEFRLADEAADQKALRDVVSEQVSKDKAAEGKDYDRNTEMAVRAVDVFGDDDFKSFLDGTVVEGLPLGEHPAFRKVFAKIGRRMGEDVPMLEHDNDKVASLQKQHADLTREINDAIDRGDSKTAKRLDAERQRITERLVPPQPIVGTAGRTA